MKRPAAGAISIRATVWLSAAALIVAVIGFSALALCAAPADAATSPGPAVIFTFDYQGKSFVHYRDVSSATAYGSVPLTADTVEWARQLIHGDAPQAYRALRREDLSLRDIRYFQAKDQAQQYHALLEAGGALPWGRSYRTAVQPPARFNPQPMPVQPRPTPVQPQPYTYPQPQPQAQPLQMQLSWVPQAPRAGDVVNFQVTVYDPADPGAQFEIYWNIAGEGTSGQPAVGYRFRQPGTQHVTVAARNPRTGAEGNLVREIVVVPAAAATQPVQPPGRRPPERIDEPPVEPPVWQPPELCPPLPPDTDGGESGRRTQSGGGIGAIGRVPGVADLFQLLVGVLGPGAIALIIHLINQLFGGLGDGGSTVTEDLPPGGPTPPESPPEKQPPPAPPSDAKTAGALPPGAKPPDWRKNLTEDQRHTLRERARAMRDGGQQDGRDVSTLDEFGKAVREDVATLPGFAKDVAKGVRDGAKAAYRELSDPGNWEVADDALIESVKDVTVRPMQGLREIVDGAEVAGGVAKQLAVGIYKNPWGFVKGITGIDNWEKVVDGKVPLGERLCRALYGAFDTAMGVFTVGEVGEKVLTRAGLLKEAGEAVDGAGDAARAVEGAGDGARAVEGATDGARAVEGATDGARAVSAGRDGATAADGAHDAGAVRKAGEAADAGAVQKASGAEREADRFNEATDFDARNSAWERAAAAGKQKVDEFESALLTDDTARIRKAMIEVQGDKAALKEINRRGTNLKLLYNQRLGAVYNATDDAVKAKLAAEFGVPVKDVEVFGATNLSTVPKVGADRDITFRVIRHLKDGGIRKYDVPAAALQKYYDAAFAKAALGDGAAAMTAGEIKGFAQKLDQVCTDYMHADAYGRGPADLDMAIKFPHGDFSDPTQIGQVMAYKSEELYRHADTMREEAAALARAGEAAKADELRSQVERIVGEGMRQNSKQWRNQVLKRFGALRDEGVAVKMDTRLAKAVSYLQEVEDGAKTPGQAEEALRAMGYSVDRVSEDTGKFVEMLQKLRPPRAAEGMNWEAPVRLGQGAAGSMEAPEGAAPEGGGP